MFLLYKNIIVKVEQVQLLGVTNADIQEMFEKAIEQSTYKPGLMFLDASYLYTFHLDDFEYVKKLNLLTRRDHTLVIEWHRLLERWYQDQTVRDSFGKIIKPIKISRSLDRVVNEGMEMIANALTGGTLAASFEFRSIGDGDIDEPTPADTDLVDEVDTINVNETPDGGSLSRDGTTIYSIGNHSKSVETPTNGEFTECGMFDKNVGETDQHMLDHSVFDDPVPHTQNVDSPGSTTVVYLCSS